MKCVKYSFYRVLELCTMNKKQRIKKLEKKVDGRKVEENFILFITDGREPTKEERETFKYITQIEIV